MHATSAGTQRKILRAPATRSKQGLEAAGHFQLHLGGLPGCLRRLSKENGFPVSMQKVEGHDSDMKKPRQEDITQALSSRALGGKFRAASIKATRPWNRQRKKSGVGSLLGPQA